MRKLAIGLLLSTAAIATIATAHGFGPDAGKASSHREAPLIAEDPPRTRRTSMRSEAGPAQHGDAARQLDPGGGHRREAQLVHVLAAGPLRDPRRPDGDGKPEVSYLFRFRNRAPVAFLGNTVQDYTGHAGRGGRSTVLANGLATPPNNIGPRSTPNYRAFAVAGVYDLPGGGKVFAGQREDAFFGDIGAIFDLVAIPPRNRRDGRREGLLRRLRRSLDR